MSNRNRNRIRDSNSGICDAVRKEINRYITMWNEDRITFLKELSPYMVIGYMGDIVSKNVSSHLEAGSLEAVIDTFQEIINLTADYIPSLALKDISYGIAFALCLKLLVYAKSLDSKKFRKGEEYGSASFGTKADIDPFMDIENFFNNVILSATEKIWDVDLRYRIAGHEEKSNGQTILCFLLKDAQCFVPVATEQNGRTIYKKQMPKEWEMSFGISHKEYGEGEFVLRYAEEGVYEIELPIRKERIEKMNHAAEKENEV